MCHLSQFGFACSRSYLIEYSSSLVRYDRLLYSYWFLSLRIFIYHSVIVLDSKLRFIVSLHCMWMNAQAVSHLVALHIRLFSKWIIMLKIEQHYVSRMAEMSYHVYGLYSDEYSVYCSTVYSVVPYTGSDCVLADDSLRGCILAWMSWTTEGWDHWYTEVGAAGGGGAVIQSSNLSWHMSRIFCYFIRSIFVLLECYTVLSCY